MTTPPPTQRARHILAAAVIVSPPGSLLGADGVILGEIEIVRPPAGWYNSP